MVAMGPLRDCEAVVHAFLGQPVNSLTALAFVAGGVFIAVRSRHVWLGVASIATGAGSFLFHGPMPPLSEWAHDSTLAWLLLVVAGTGRRWEGSTRVPGLIAVAAICAVPGAGDPLGVILAIGAIISILTRDRSRATLAALALLAVVAVIGRLGATGGPLCDPGSVLQAHGLWHIGAAAAVVWWALGLQRDVPG